MQIMVTVISETTVPPDVRQMGSQLEWAEKKDPAGRKYLVEESDECESAAALCQPARRVAAFSLVPLLR